MMSNQSAIGQSAIGEAVTRKEDKRFLTGRGLFTDNIRSLNQLYVSMVRSQHAAGEITAVHTHDAAHAPGVQLVLTGSDYAEDGLGSLVCTSLPPGLVKEKTNLGNYVPIAHKRVNCVGDIIALVVAESREEARDAAELVTYDINETDPVITINDALQNERRVVPDRTNIAFTASLGDQSQIDKAFELADKIVEKKITVPRILACAMEPRAIHASYEHAKNRFHITTSTQSPHRIKQALALLFQRTESDFHVTAPDVGGGFGSKGNLSAEEVLMCWVCEKLDQPISWCPARSEAFIADYHGRDMSGVGRLALDKKNQILAADFEMHYNMGFALGPSGGVSPLLCMRMVQGVYDFPILRSKVTGVLSNLRPTTSYRGAGRPEATLLVESLMDEAAYQCGLDTLEFRKRHFIKSDQMPFKTGLLDTYDSGDFGENLDRAKTLFDWDGFENRRIEAKKAGKLLGRGLANYVEVCGVFSERMEVAVDASGNVNVTAGTSSHGQGHETVYAQMVSEWFGVPLSKVSLTQGDTDRVHFGRGTWGSRSIAIGGSALKVATDKAIHKARQLAAFYTKSDLEDILFEDGIFRVKNTNKTLSLQNVAAMAYSRPDTPVEIGIGIEAVGYFDAKPQNYPNGSHMVEVEIDPQTGFVRVTKFLCVDDVGNVINPLLLDGQIHGGFTQAIGEVLSEQVCHDATGQLLTSSFMDYGIPRAAQVPRMNTALNNHPSSTNPLGAKGGAEVGIVGGVSALVLALRDALLPLGITDIPLPATPAKLWSLIQEADSKKEGTK